MCFHPRTCCSTLELAAKPSYFAAKSSHLLPNSRNCCHTFAPAAKPSYLLPNSRASCQTLALGMQVDIGDLLRFRSTVVHTAQPVAPSTKVRIPFLRRTLRFDVACSHPRVGVGHGTASRHGSKRIRLEPCIRFLALGLRRRRIFLGCGV